MKIKKLWLKDIAYFNVSFLSCKMLSIMVVILAIFLISATSYAVEVSIGSSIGGGIPFLRGDTYTEYSDNSKSGLEAIGATDITPSGYVLAMPRFDVMIEFLPFLAMEVGVGYRYSIGKLDYKIDDVNYSSIYKRSEIYIPVMLRGQIEYTVGVTYISAGAKAFLSIDNEYNTLIATDGEGYLTSGTLGSSSVGAKSAIFVLDASFAIGQEFRIFDCHYLGIRVEYDLNILHAFQNVASGDASTTFGVGTPFAQNATWNHDNITASLTYRYAFNSKWN